MTHELINPRHQHLSFEDIKISENECAKEENTELFQGLDFIYIYIYIILGRQSPYGYRANISNIITIIKEIRKIQYKKEL